MVTMQSKVHGALYGGVPTFQCGVLPTSLMRSYIPYLWGKGAGGVPWVQIMENEFEYLADRGGHGGYLGEKFVKKYRF